MVRMLTVIVLIAVGIRLIYWLLAPVVPYLAAAVIVFTIYKLVSWYRNRW